MDPLTVLLTDEKKKKKLEQQKAKAPPPGASRILTRATREHKKAQKSNITPSPIPPLNKKNEESKPDSSPVKQEVKTENNNSVHKSAAHGENQVNPAAENTDEWQNLGEELNPENNFEHCEKMINDEGFLSKLKQRLVYSKTLMLEGKLEGASMFREVINNNFRVN